MRVSGRLSAVALFAGVSLLALVVSGLFDWISSSLFLLMECLVQGLRRLFGHPKHVPSARHWQPHKLPRGSRFLKPRSGKLVRAMRKPPRTPSPQDPTPELCYQPRKRVLVVLRGNEPDLVTFALEECQSRNAELLLLLLRPLAFIPMGPNPLPGFAEDDEANALFEYAKTEARRLAISLQTFYEVTANPTPTILNLAKHHEADLVIVSSKKQGPFSRAFAGDMARSILAKLPRHASLMVRAT